MEVGCSHQSFQTILPAIPVQTRLQVPEIEVTHSGDERHTLLRRSRGDCSWPSNERLRHSSTTSEPSCIHDTSNKREQCLSLMLPLEVELDVLGVVEQDVIDRGQFAKCRRNKRNSEPEISHRSPAPVQKVRPRSFSSQSDLYKDEFHTPMHRCSLALPTDARSSTLCSTEL